MMKILLLQPPSPPYMNVKRDYAGGMGVADPSDRPSYGHDSGYIALPYMSLLNSAAVLEKKDLEVTFVDAQTDDLDIDGVVGRVRESNADVVVCVLNLPSIFCDLEVLKSVRERSDGVRTIAVGAVTTPLFDEIADSGAVDAIVRGDPEVILAGLVNVLMDRSQSEAGEESTSGSVGQGWGDRFETRKGVLTNKKVGYVTDLDALPELPYHLVPLERYRYHGFGKNVPYAPVFASRGCSFRCYYCPYPTGFGDRIVHRDPVRVVDEIERLQRQYGVKGILFRDQVFTMDWEKTHRLCDEIIKRRLEIEWVVETRLDRVNEELLEKMKRAGCTRIHYGLESGDPNLFSRVGKDAPEGRMERLIENFLATEKVGIHPHMFVLIGLLGEDPETIQRTIETIRRIKPLTLQVAIVTPYPGTPLFQQVKEKGLLLTEDWAQYTGFKPVARTEALSASDLVEARQRIILKHRKAIRLKKVLSLTRLGLRYTADGSILRRLMAKIARG